MIPNSRTRTTSSMSRRRRAATGVGRRVASRHAHDAAAFGLAGRGGDDRLLGGVGVRELRDEAAFAHDEDAVGEAQDLGKLGGDHQDRDALAGELVEQPVDLGLRADVDPARRLVDDEQRGAAAQPLREHDLLLVAARERAHRVREAAVLDLQPERPVGGRSVAPSVPRMNPSRLSRRERRERDVAHDRRAHHEALLAAVLGDEADPGGHRGASARLAGASVRAGRPSRRRSESMPKIARATSLRPEPTRPASATISPARTSKLDVEEDAFAA